MAADVSKLAEVPLFALLNSEDRHTLAKLFNTVQVDRGDLIFGQGDPGSSMYIIRRGKVEVFITDDRGQRMILATNGPGDLFGEISLLDGGVRTASVVAVDGSELLVLDREDLHEYLTRRPSAAFGLLTVMGGRLRTTNELLLMHASRNVNLVDEQRLTLGQRVSDRVATLVGSWFFLAALAVGVVAVLLVGPALGAAAQAFNTLSALNLVLILLLTLVTTCTLMAQNHQMAKDRLKADLEYKLNLKTEMEVGQMINILNRVSDQLQNGRPRPAGEGMAPSRRSPA